MGNTLKSTDILKEIKADQASLPNVAPKPNLRQSKSKPKEDRSQIAAAIGEGKPSVYQTDLRAKLRQKTQLNFASMPMFIKDEFERLCDEAGMNKREYFYHLLRQQGADIPPYEDMDGRKL